MYGGTNDKDYYNAPQDLLRGNYRLINQCRLVKLHWSLTKRHWLINITNEKNYYPVIDGWKFFSHGTGNLSEWH
ncbi:hypothetical protein GCM10022209_26120 [Chitinophaga oryziterrae]